MTPLILTNKVAQKEAYWLCMRINFDASKCHVAWITTQIDSVILVESETLQKGLLLHMKYTNILRGGFKTQPPVDRRFRAVVVV